MSARVGALLALWVCAGCSPKRGDVLTWQRGNVDLLRERIRKVAGSLPPPGEVARYAGHPPVEPLALLAADLDNRTNADVLMAEALLDPHARPAFRLESKHLQRILALADGQGSDEEALQERDRNFRAEVKHVLALRYLVVVRVVEKRESQVVLEAFLVDLATGGIRAAVGTTVDPKQAATELDALLHRATGGTFQL